TPPALVDETSRRLDELDRFFTEQRDVLEYFLPEAVEHLESMAQSLVALESEGASESELAALFRAVHTLKGAAYTVGCGVIGDLAHRVEDMLGEVREQKRPLDRGAIETVFAGLDALRLLVRSAEERSDTRVAAYERATALLDALPPIGAAIVESSPSIAPELEQAAGATVMTSASAPGQVSLEETPPAPPDETARRLDELDRFFTEQHDVLEYFLPEAVEHLESMAQSLVALEGEGSSESELAALFRAVHTLKGAAYTVGCGGIGSGTCAEGWASRSVRWIAPRSRSSSRVSMRCACSCGASRTVPTRVSPSSSVRRRCSMHCRRSGRRSSSRPASSRSSSRQP